MSKTDRKSLLGYRNILKYFQYHSPEITYLFNALFRGQTMVTCRELMAPRCRGRRIHLRFPKRTPIHVLKFVPIDKFMNSFVTYLT